LELTVARIAEDERLIRVIESYDEPALKALHSYKTTSECRNRKFSERHCCISSTIKRITEDRRMLVYRY